MLQKSIDLRKTCWFCRIQNNSKQSHYVRFPALELLCNNVCGRRTKGLESPNLDKCSDNFARFRIATRFPKRCTRPRNILRAWRHWQLLPGYMPVYGNRSTCTCYITKPHVRYSYNKDRMCSEICKCTLLVTTSLTITVVILIRSVQRLC